MINNNFGGKILSNTTNTYVIGYGTFLLQSFQQQYGLIPVEVVVIRGFRRIFHPNLPYQFPFLWESKPNAFFKGVVFQIAKKSLISLDIYEGVPSLYQRINYPLKLDERDLSPCYLYVPTKSVLTRLQAEIDLYLTPKEREILFNSDLWLDYLREQEPELVQKFPALFVS